MKNKLNFDINVMNKITKNLLLNLNQNIKNYPHNKVVSKIENFKLIQYFFSRSLIKPTTIASQEATIINNNSLFKNTISPQSWPKLINNIIKILKSFFNSLNCIISKPKFIFMPNKIIIRINYYQSLNLLNKNNTLLRLKTANALTCASQVQKQQISALSNQQQISALSNQQKFINFINKFNKIINQKLIGSGIKNKALINKLIITYLKDLINLNINNINAILFLNTNQSEPKNNVNNIINIIPNDIINKSIINTNIINNNIKKLFKKIFWLNKLIAKEYSQRWSLYSVNKKWKKNNYMGLAKDWRLISQSVKFNKSLYSHLARVVKISRAQKYNRSFSILSLISYLYNNLNNGSLSAIASGFAKHGKGTKKLIERKRRLNSWHKRNIQQWNKRSHVDIIKKNNKLLKKFDLNYIQKKIFENKNNNRIFLGSNNRGIASQTMYLLDYYKISKILFDILNTNISQSASAINEVNKIKEGVAAKPCLAKDVDITSIKTKKMNEQIINNLMFILLIKIGNNFIKEYNNLIKFIILKYTTTGLATNATSIYKKSEHHLLHTKQLKINYNLLKYLILKKFTASFSPIDGKTTININKLKKFINLYTLQSLASLETKHENVSSLPIIMNEREINMGAAPAEQETKNVNTESDIIKKIKEIFLSYLKLLNIKNISSTSEATTTTQSFILQGKGFATQELSNNILKNNNIKFKFLGILLSKILGKNVELQLIKLHNVGLDQTILAQIISSNSKKYKLRILLKKLWKKIKLNNSKSFLANATSILKSNKNIKINKSIKNIFKEYFLNRRKGNANFELYKNKMWINTNYIKACNIEKKIINYLIYKNNNKDLLRNKNFINNPLTSTKVTGIKIRVSGRLNKEKIVPRKTVKTIQIGNLNKKSVSASFVDSASYLSKNKKGSFNVKVWMSHSYR
jgi:hypothetical protein